VVVRRQLRRSQVEGFFARLAPVVVGMEACGSAHYWARQLESLGHEVRLMAPAYVKRNKTDGRDAEAICEAMQRPVMRFVAVKSVEQQAVTGLLARRPVKVAAVAQAAKTARIICALLSRGERYRAPARLAA
jgi:transposase